MSTENPNYGYTRRQELSCTEQELSGYANVVLLDREVLYVKRNDGAYDVKIGDGVKPIGELPYSIRHSEVTFSLKENGILTIYTEEE